MKTPMLEKVARAMFEHEWAGQQIPEGEWRSGKAYWLGFARIALQALAEPDETMVEASFIDDGRGSDVSPDLAVQVFTAMIHAAMGTTPNTPQGDAA